MSKKNSFQQNIFIENELIINDQQQSPQGLQQKLIKQKLFLQEIKQFLTFYTIFADKIKAQLKNNMLSDSELLQLQDEVRRMEKNKDLFYQMYQNYLKNHNQSILPFIELMQKEIFENQTVPMNLLKITVKSLSKIIEISNPSINLVYDAENKQFDPSILIKTLIGCQIDDHSNQIDHQEHILLSIQNLILKIISCIPCSKETIQTIFQFFGRLLEQRGFTQNFEMGQTIHFSEEVKQNMRYMFQFLVLSSENQQYGLTELEAFIIEKIDKFNKLESLDLQTMSNQQKIKEGEKLIKAISFGLKTIEEIIIQYAIQQTEEQFTSLIVQNIDIFVKLTSLACEQNDEIIRNQGQMLFQFLFSQIIQMKLPVREQLEIMYVKCVLKPVIIRIETLHKKKEESLKKNKDVQVKDQEWQIDFSDQEDGDDDQQYTKKKKVDGVSENLIGLGNADYWQDLLFELGMNFLTDIIITLNHEDLANLFLIYDTQHFSESIITKSLNLIMRHNKDKPTKLAMILENIFNGFDSQSLQNEDSQINSQIINVTHQRIKYMIDQKSQQKQLARQCNLKPKLFLNKCEEIYKFIDEDAPWDVASKILLYSRELLVENVIEIIGGKEKRNQTIYNQFLEKQDFKDAELEFSLRRFMQTFRLAGVESQVVLRVMEGFAFKFFEKDYTKIFVNKDECYDMAYLIIVLQTTMHNPSIKQKLRAIDFINQAKSNCPLSYDQLPKDYVQILYDRVAKKEIFAPLSRNWYHQNFNEGDLNICNIKLSSITEYNNKIEQTQFVSSADLTQKSLFNYNNEIDAINQNDKQILIAGAISHIYQNLSKRFINNHMNKKGKSKEEHQTLNKILEVNIQLYSYEFTDRILRSIYQIDQSDQSLITQIIKNFDTGSKNTVTLIPQIILSKGVSYSQNKGFLINVFGQIDQKYLLEICQASERFFRKQINDISINIQKQILHLEGKTPQMIDEIIKKQQSGVFGARLLESQGLSSNTGGNQYPGNSQNNSSSFSLVNIVFNYFNESNDGQGGPISQENQSQINKLKKKLENLKTMQIDQMKFMNQLFASLIQHNCPKQTKNNQFCYFSEYIQEEEMQFDKFIYYQLNNLVQKILVVVKENLFNIIKTKDGLYSMLFIKNVTNILIKELILQNEKFKDSDEEFFDQQLCIDTIWQEIHLIMSKLTSTKRKVAYLKKSSQSIWTQVPSSSEIMKDDDDLSALDSSRSEDFIQTFETSSSNSSSTKTNTDLMQNDKDHQSQGIDIKMLSSNRTERRVYEALCKHLILEIFFDVNQFQIAQISGVYENENHDFNKLIEIQRNIKRNQKQKNSQVKKLRNSDLNQEGIKKDIQECVREVWRIFKSIVQGPCQNNEKRDFENFLDEDIQLTQNDVVKIFDDLHVIILMDKFLQIEKVVSIENQQNSPPQNFKILQNEVDDESNISEGQVIKILPLQNYDKIFKLVKNLMIHSLVTVESLQMEVFVQNIDNFTQLIQNSLKYLKSSTNEKKLIPYELIDLIINFITKITQKSRIMGIEVEISQLINIFGQIFEILNQQNQIELWSNTMLQYQQSVMFNQNLLKMVNWEQNLKYTFLAYKNSTLNNKIDFYLTNSFQESDSSDQKLQKFQKLFININEMFETLFISFNIEFLLASYKITKDDLKNNETLKRFHRLCDTQLENSNEVYLYILHQFTDNDQLNVFEQDEQVKEEFTSFFKSLWFQHLKYQLSFVDQIKSLQIKVQDNLKKCMIFQQQENRLFLNNDSNKQNFFEKSFKIIDTFFPSLKNEIQNY